MPVSTKKTIETFNLPIPEGLLSGVSNEVKNDEKMLTELLYKALKIGLLSISQANVSLSTESYYQTVDNLHNQFIKTLEEYFDDDGLMSSSLDQILADPNNSLNQSLGNIKNTLIELAVKIENQNQVKSLIKRTALKGVPLEETVAHYLNTLCRHSATVECIGTTSGTGNSSKSGDIFIQLPDNQSIVVECKSGNFTLTGMHCLSKELEKAKKIRNADFAIAVVTKSYKKNNQSLIDIRDDQAFIVIDPDNYEFGFLPLEAAFVAIRYKLQVFRPNVTYDNADLLLQESQKFINFVNQKMGDFQVINNSVAQIEKSAATIRETSAQIKLEITREIMNLQRLFV